MESQSRKIKVAARNETEEKKKEEKEWMRRALSRAPCEFSLKSVIKTQRVLSAFLLRLPPVAVTVAVIVAASLTSRLPSEGIF